MPQLSLYLDDETMDRLREDAAREGVSLSRFARMKICEQKSAHWPESFWGTYGALDDETFVLPEKLDFAMDAPRGSFND